MPSFSGSANNLVETGPIVEMRIGVSRAWTSAMSEATPPIEPPAPVSVAAMIDTGAGVTVINRDVASALGLHPVGVKSIIGAIAVTPEECEAFAVDLNFPEGLTISDTLVVCLPLARQNIQCLIGRDVLARCVLVYIGHLNQYTLSM